VLKTEAELVASVLEILGQGVHWVCASLPGCKFVWGCASLCEAVQVYLRLCKFMWDCASLFETVQVYVRLCKFVFTAICIPILITATPLEYLLLYYCYITAILLLYLPLY
jgi:hypothetical protein